MARPRNGLLLAAVAAVALAAGCGSSGGGASTRADTSHRAAPSPSSAPPPAGSGGRAIPAPAPTGTPADPAAVRVIRAWSSALRSGDVRRAARYFALPSEFVNELAANGRLPVFKIHSRLAAYAANATLPCGAQLISADQRGRYVNALFRLTDRPGPGGGCGAGTGQMARTNFLIAAGRIVQWIRAPDDPGDGRPAPVPRVPAVPSAPQSPGPAV